MFRAVIGALFLVWSILTILIGVYLVIFRDGLDRFLTVHAVILILLSASFLIFGVLLV